MKREWVLDLVLTAVTFVVSFAFTFGPGAYRMSLPPTLLISVAAAGAVWLSGRRQLLALALTLLLTVSIPLLDSSFQAMDIVIVFVAYRARGLTNEEIAEHAFISKATVKSHVSHILVKLGLSTRLEVVVWAYERGLVRPGET